jgi:hypothetical protein
MGPAPVSRSAGLIVLLGMSVLGPTQAGAQSPPAPGPPPAGPAPPPVEVVVPRPPSEFGFERATPPDRPREEEFYPERTRSYHDPAFVSGASRTLRTSATSGTRVGLSGWTAPRVPFDDRESSGGVAFGLTIEWGVPLPAQPEAVPQPATPGQR